jgi:hypothetical protein
MSKEAGLRAMREARYAARAAAPRPAARPAAPVAPKAPAPARAPKAVPEPASEPTSGAAAVEEDGLCGHRSINGRTCTREKGHAAKNHRYS